MIRIPFKSWLSDGAGVRLQSPVFRRDLLPDYGGDFAMESWQAGIAWSRIQNGICMDSVGPGAAIPI